MPVADARILVIDDDPDTRANFCDILRLDDYECETAGSVAEVLDRESWTAIWAVILDRKLPDGTSEDLLPRIRRLAPHASVIIVTGFADIDSAVAALHHGAEDYLLKPINPDALRAALRRITERRQLAAARDRSETAFRALVEAVPCMIVILDGDHTIRYFSAQAEKMTGWTAAEVLERDYFPTFLHPTFHRPVAEEIRKILAGSTTVGFENPVLCKDGSVLRMVWNATGLPDYEGEPVVLAVGQDITRIKDAQDRALQAERLATIGQMMATLSHESRNNLQAVRFYLDALVPHLEERPEALEVVGRIRQAVDDVRHLYEDVRGFSSPIVLETMTCRLSGVVEDVWESLEPQRQGRRAELHLRIDDSGGEIDDTCEIDRLRLRQVFRNMLENSLAACEDPVIISVALSAAALDGRDGLRATVRDNGPGLSPQQRRRIFEPFFTTKTRGTGLGMAIVQRIVEAHGGRIEVGGRRPGAELILTLPQTLAVAKV